MTTLSDTKFKEIFPFSTPRNNQREIIEKIISAYKNGKKYVILSAPTGAGKSAIGYSVARYFKSSYILTSQKILQDQYYKDFAIPFVLGRNNYGCLKNEALTCEMGACYRDSRKFCKNENKEVICPYLVKRENCLSAPHSNLNYSYFLALSNNTTFLKEKEIIICDESHFLENELIKTYCVKLDQPTMKCLGNFNTKIPSLSKSDPEKCKWLCYDFFEEARSQYLYMKNQLASLSGLKSTKEYKKINIKYGILEKLLIQIELIKKMLDNNEKIVITHTSDYIEYKMLHSKMIFKNTISMFSQRFLFMSATFLDYKIFISDLGIPEGETEFIECDSTFPVENRLIYYTPVGSMSFKNKQHTIPLLIKEIDGILKKFKDVKGIIHTVNYEIAEKIIDGLAFSDQSYRLLMPRGATRNLVLDTFYNSEKPYVLISPSLAEGIDLKEDLSRLCIICKVPYTNLTDKWVCARKDENPQWYSNNACINLVQMTGRSVRSETDFATTYILDSDFINLAKRSTNIFPKWWQDAVIMK